MKKIDHFEGVMNALSFENANKILDKRFRPFFKCECKLKSIEPFGIARVNRLFIVNLINSNQFENANEKQFYCKQHYSQTEKNTYNHKLLIKLTNPTWKSAKTKCEATSMIFLRKHLHSFVPEVFAFEFDSNKSEIAPFEYILMEFVKDTVPLNSIGIPFQEISLEKRTLFLSTLRTVLIDLKKITSNKIGSFSVSNENENISEAIPLVAFQQIPNENKKVGPFNRFLDYYFAYFDVHFQMLEERYDSSVTQNHEVNHVEQLVKPLIQPYVAKLRTFRKQIDDNENKLFSEKENGVFVLSHSDLQAANILVEKETLKLVSIVDWEWCSFLPREIEFLRGFDFLNTMEQKRSENSTAMTITSASTNKKTPLEEFMESFGVEMNKTIWNCLQIERIVSRLAYVQFWTDNDQQLIQKTNEYTSKLNELLKEIKF